VHQIEVHRLQISPVSWLSGFASSHLPTTLPFANDDPVRTAERAIRCSGLRATYPALQSRGGDGFQRQETAMAVARLPEHEIRGHCGLQQIAAGL